MKGSIVILRDENEEMHVFIGNEESVPCLIDEVVGVLRDQEIYVDDLISIREFEEDHNIALDIFAFDTDLYPRAYDYYW